MTKPEVTASLKQWQLLRGFVWNTVTAAALSELDISLLKEGRENIFSLSTAFDKTLTQINPC